MLIKLIHQIIFTLKENRSKQKFVFVFFFTSFDVFNNILSKILYCISNLDLTVIGLSPLYAITRLQNINSTKHEKSII